MQYRIDKKSGNKLSVLGFGCMRLPQNIGAIDMKKSEALIMKAINSGVNYFDTAYMYPGSEEALGAILEKNQARNKVFIATKLPLLFVKGSADFDKFFNKELERLRTSSIDYYLMHMITDHGQWQQLKTWGIEEWLVEQKKQGRIRQAGFSFHGSVNEFLKVLDAYDWDFCQIQYNYSNPNFQAGVTGLKKAAERMPVVIMEPLLGGKLANGLPPEAVSIFKKTNPALSPAAWGLRWVWDQAEATVVLSGMSAQSQLEENLAVADKATTGMLSATEHEAYQQVLTVFNASYKIHCTGCAYCMPCPRNVNIPACFAAYNTSFSMGFANGMQQYTTSTGVTSARRSGAGLCIKCGKCEGHCPQHLPIRQHLTVVYKRMEPFWFRFVITVVRVFLGKNRDR
ncbi:MAG: aldo/keto reductase [Treponema sp.]|nr:aldo/keto reductase [Treponema sp.]